MTQKTIQGNADLAKQIRLRRSELGLTIEEAASRAGVGTKTWCRYEAGESIRSDKCKGVCKALELAQPPRPGKPERPQSSLLKNIRTMKRGPSFWRMNSGPGLPFPLP